MFSVRSMCFLLRSFKKYSPNIGRFFRGSVTFSRRERFINLFFFCVEPYVPHVFLTCACFFLFVCHYVRSYAPARKHNVGLFSSIFVFVKKCLPATCYFSVVYKNIQKFPQKIVAQELQNRKKCVPLQPLSRGRAAENDRLVKRGRLSKALHPSILPCRDAREREKDKPGEVLLKNFFEKKLRKNLEGKKKRLTFATAFPLKRELKKR